MAKILLVEDEPGLCGAIKEWLTEEHHLVEIAATGKEALQRLADSQYDIILLDWMLPELSGIEVCRRYRSEGGAAPVIMLTAKKSLLSKEVGLDSGADDYLTKPFHLRELSARIRAFLRRPMSAPVDTLKVADISLNRTKLTVVKGEEPIHLLPKEFTLIEVLMRNQGKTMTTESLLDQVWGTNTDVTSETLRSNIRTLRRKIDTPGKPSLIITVHGVGYRIEDPVVE
jgi:DNA-binding response OmpR family regulator